MKLSDAVIGCAVAIVVLLLVLLLSLGLGMAAAWAITTIWPTLPFWPIAILSMLILGALSSVSKR